MERATPSLLKGGRTTKRTLAAQGGPSNAPSLLKGGPNGLPEIPGDIFLP